VTFRMKEQIYRVISTSLAAVLKVALLTIASYADDTPRACEQPFPEGVGIIGLSQTTAEWQIYLSPDSTKGWLKKSTELEPRTFHFSLARDEILFLASDNSIISHKISDNSAKEVAADTDLLRQPSLSQDVSTYYAVRFTDNKSSDTELLEVPRNSPGSSIPVGEQPGSMFSPVLDIRNRWLLYTIAHCTKGCGRIIQEVWRKDLATERSDQLTLLGEMSSDPVGDSQSGTIYFSHVSEGQESVLKYNVEQRQVEKTYNPGITNRHPALTKQGDLLILSVLGNKPVIVKYDAATDAACLYNLPDSIIAARELVADKF